MRIQIRTTRFSSFSTKLKMRGDGLVFVGQNVVKYRPRCTTYYRIITLCSTNDAIEQNTRLGVRPGQNDGSNFDRRIIKKKFFFSARSSAPRKYFPCTPLTVTVWYRVNNYRDGVRFRASDSCVINTKSIRNNFKSKSQKKWKTVHNAIIATFV